MDIAGLERLLAGIESGDIRVVARDLTEPSPLALEVLSARPYAYLDDAPLEERRTQAVMSRRWLVAGGRVDLGRLDPEAIARVRSEAWPEADQRRRAARRAGLARLPHRGRSRSRSRAGATGSRSLRAAAARDAARRARDAPLWITAERLPQFQALWPAASFDARDRGAGRLCRARHGRARTRWSRSCAAGSRGSGPVTQDALAAPLGLAPAEIAAALAALEAEGFAMRGRFTPGARPRRNGASAGCWRASTATPSSGCAPRSSRWRRATSCASCSPGSA